MKIEIIDNSIHAKDTQETDSEVNFGPGDEVFSSLNETADWGIVIADRGYFKDKSMGLFTW